MGWMRESKGRHSRRFVVGVLKIFNFKNYIEGIHFKLCAELSCTKKHSLTRVSIPLASNSRSEVEFDTVCFSYWTVKAVEGTKSKLKSIYAWCPIKGHWQTV